MTDDQEKNILARDSLNTKKNPAERKSNDLQIRINPDRDHHLPVNYRARLDDKPSGFKTFGSKTKHFTRINMTREVPKLSFFSPTYTERCNKSAQSFNWHTP